MTGPTLAVVKVGGSLFDWPELPNRLAAYLEERHVKGGREQTVLIAGGGRAADWIRSLDQVYQLGDETAHALAVHALDLTAAILARLLPGSIMVDRLDMLSAARDSAAIPILAPRNVLTEIERRGRSPFPANWDVTSDTIAASIASHLEARCLVLIKSASVPTGATREDAVRLGLVDRILPRAARSIPQVELVNLRSNPLDRRILPP